MLMLKLWLRRIEVARSDSGDQQDADVVNLMESEDDDGEEISTPKITIIENVVVVYKCCV